MRNTHNVDHSEIEKFSETASRWWDKEGDVKTLHQINPLRLSFIKKHTSLTNKKVIDIGCGGGILSESLAENGGIVSGIDLSHELIKVAKLHGLESKIHVDYQCISTEEIAQQQAQQFDIVTCMELLEHVPEPQSIIAASAKLVKSGGKLFFSTINRNPKSYLLAIVAAEYCLKMLPKGTHDYSKFIRPSELRRWCQANDLTLVDATGIQYHPLDKTFSLTSNIDVNYIMCFEKN